MGKGQGELSGVMEMSYIFFAVVVTYQHPFVKTHPTVSSKCAQWIIHKLHPIKWI